MKCGSTRPVAILRSAATKRRSSFTGVRARAREPEIDMGRIVLREMVLDAHRFQHPGVADQLGQLRTFIRPVQPGGHQHRDLRGRDPGRHQSTDHRLQEECVRHRAGDVADQDAGARLATRELFQRRAADRRRQGAVDHRRCRRRHGERRLADHGRPSAVGHRDPEQRLSVGQIDLHSLPLAHQGCAG